MLALGTHRLSFVLLTCRVEAERNYDWANTLMLEASANKILMDFDLGLAELSHSVYKVARVSLRVFLTCFGTGTRSIYIRKIPLSVDWDGQHVTLDGQNPNSIMTQVRPANAGSWIEIDVTSISDMNEVNRFVLSMKDSSGGTCEIASRQTCHSSKLVIAIVSI